MQKIYSRINWENFPSEKTAVNESNLNKMDLAIDNLDDRVVAMDASKVDLTKANELVEEILWDESNGTLTVVKMNGSRAVIDTKLEKLAVNFTYNPQTQQLVITLDDGTVQNVDLSSLITEYEFLDSDTISFEITGGKVKAIVKNGSITEDHLSPDYIGEIRTQVGRAEMSAKSADASEKNAASSSALSKSYAVGGTGTRDGEDTDNAKYYMEQAKAVSAVDIATTEKAGIVKPDGTTITADEDGTLHGVAKITVDTALSSTSTNPVQNKVVTSNLIDIRKETTVNLIIPDLQTVTKNGVTCTNNGDGTYTFNGTATKDSFFDINKNIPINKGTEYKAVCFKDEDYVPNKIMSCVRRVDITNEYVYNNGSFVSDAKNCWLWIKIAKNVTVSNLVAKPMLTTNLSATYDDFVPYTGDTGRLNGDVAELKAQSVKKDNVVNNQTTTEEGFALDARQANPNIDGTLAKQVADLNGSLNIHKAIWKDIKVQGDAVNTYQEVFSYTPESDCLISLYANAYYSSGKPIGLKASVAGNIVDPGDTNEMIVSKAESDNYKEIIISCNVYVLAGHKIKIEEKISSSGYFAGGIVYAINRL